MDRAFTWPMEGSSPRSLGHGTDRDAPALVLARPSEDGQTSRSLFVEDAGVSRLVTAGERARGDLSILGPPLLQGEEVLRALCVGGTDAHVVDPGQQRSLEIVAASAAKGIATRMLADRRDDGLLAVDTFSVELAEPNAELLERHEVSPSHAWLRAGGVIQAQLPELLR